MQRQARYLLTTVVGSGLVWVIVGFILLIAINLTTFALGPTNVLAVLDGKPWGPLVSVFVFDSWGTAAGLAGVVVLFAPVLFGVRASRRLELSIFFLLGSIAFGIIANVVWSEYYADGGPIGAGSSSIAIAGQGIIFAMAVLGLVQLLATRQGHGGIDPTALPREWREFFLVVYLTLIVSSLYFVLVLEPIFIPTLLYNWRVHEMAFLLAAAATTAYVGLLFRIHSRDIWPVYQP